MIFVSYFFDFGLHHSVVVVKSIICIFGFTDCQLQLFFNLFLNDQISTFEVIFSL